MPKTKGAGNKRSTKTPVVEVGEPMETETTVEPPLSEAESQVEAPSASPPKTASSSPKETKVVEVKKRKGKIEKKRKTGTRTPSSYVLFSMEYRKTVSSENPDLSLGEVSKKCGEAWGQLSVDEKNVWKLKADSCKEEKAAQQKAEIGDVPEKKKRKPSSYLCFSMEHRKKVIAENANLSLGEVSKRCGAAWKELNEEEKSIWKTKAAEM